MTRVLFMARSSDLNMLQKMNRKEFIFLGQDSNTGMEEVSVRLFPGSNCHFSLPYFFQLIIDT